MSDAAKVLKSLRTTQDHLDTGLKALQNNNARTVLEELPTFDVLRKDFISVISLIHSHSTRLWIALGKQPPTPSAACATLDELSKHICSLYGCTLAFTQISGPTFIAEARAAATEVLLALQCLLQEYSPGGDGEDSMRKTAALHEVCDSARNISLDDREAALKVWKQDGEVVKDAIKELNSLLKPLEDAGFSDGWDELLEEDVGITELSEEDRVAAKKVLVILEKVSALRKHAQKSAFSDKRQAQELTVSYQKTLEASKAMISNVDDVVACLDPPLDLGELRRLLAQLAGSLYSLVGACSGSADKALDGLALLDIADGESKTVQTSSASPLATKADDIVKAIQAI